MSATNSVDAILAGAKKELGKANDMTKSVEGTPTSAFAPKNEFSQASYKIAQAAKPKPKSYVQDVSEGIKNRKEMEDKALKQQ